MAHTQIREDGLALDQRELELSTSEVLHKRNQVFLQKNQNHTLHLILSSCLPAAQCVCECVFQKKDFEPTHTNCLCLFDMFEFFFPQGSTQKRKSNEQKQIQIQISQ